MIRWIWVYCGVGLNHHGVMNDTLLSRSPSREEGGRWGCSRAQCRDIYDTVFGVSTGTIGMFCWALLHPVVLIFTSFSLHLFETTIYSTRTRLCFYTLSARPWTLPGPAHNHEYRRQQIPRSLISSFQDRGEGWVGWCQRLRPSSTPAFSHHIAPADSRTSASVLLIPRRITSPYRS